MAAAGQPVVSANGPTVNVVNNYAAPPVDPHSWSKSVQFELQAAF